MKGLIIIKSKLFCDIDNTIINSTKKFVSIYNQIYKYNSNFIRANWKLVNVWDFKDQCPLVENVEDIFRMKRFFTNLSFINDNTYEVLWELNKKYQIIIVSIGTSGNIALKTAWINEHLPFIKDSIFLVNNGTKMNKDLVNMSGKGNVFLDDVVSNLNSVSDPDNNLRKIAFGDIYSWNIEWDGERVLNWTEVAELLL
jgi:hypothetical protein